MRSIKHKTGHKRRGRKRGQAMTEFLIAALFVLVPLFVFIPMLGKYIDFKHKAIQSARYQAWEYTVWYEDTDERDILENFNTGDPTFQPPEKTIEETQRESLVRIMGPVGSHYVAPDALVSPNGVTPMRGIGADDKNVGQYQQNRLWRDHRQQQFFTGFSDITYDNTGDDRTITDGDTPTLSVFGVPVGDFINLIVDVVSFGFDAISAIIGALDSFSRNNQVDDTKPLGASPPFAGAAGFQAMNLDGYARFKFDANAMVYDNTVGLRERLDEDLDDQLSASPLGFEASAGVLADGWNAGGTAHTYLQVGGATPSTLVNALLNLPGLSEIWDLISFIAPELSRCNPGGVDGIDEPFVRSPLAAEWGHLWLGYVDGDVVHPDRLSVPDENPDDRLGTHACDKSGRCVWEQAVKDLDPGLSHSPCTL